MKAVNIEWDVDFKEDRVLLPTEIELPAGMEDEEEISDYLSEVTGFCHKGFCLTETHADSFNGSKTMFLQSFDMRAQGKENSVKTLLSDQIRIADKKGISHELIKSPVFLFQENRSGNRMGKPGDANNAYYASWFKFYSFGQDLNPRDEGLSLNFKDPITNKPVPGGNGVSEVDIIESFRKANPDRNVVLLEIKLFKGDLKEKMNQALQKYKEDGQALLTLPPIANPTRQPETLR